MKKLFVNGRYICDTDMMTGSYQAEVKDVKAASDLPNGMNIALWLNRKEIVALVVAMLGGGKKIQAIKFIRQVTGWGLGPAKHFVESL